MNEQQLFERFGRVYPAGFVLFTEGDPGREMYVIQKGEVQISRRIRQRDTVIAVLGPGEFFGELAIINNRDRSATATVRRDARLLVIDSQTFEAMLHGRVEIGIRIIKSLAARLDRANQQIELLLLEDGNHRVVRCLRDLAERQAAVDGDAQSAAFIAVSEQELAAMVGLLEPAVADILGRLEEAHLVLPAAKTELDCEGYVVPEVGRLCEFLEFLETKERHKTAH